MATVPQSDIQDLIECESRGPSSAPSATPNQFVVDRLFGLSPMRYVRLVNTLGIQLFGVGRECRSMKVRVMVAAMGVLICKVRFRCVACVKFWRRRNHSYGRVVIRYTCRPRWSRARDRVLAILRSHPQRTLVGMAAWLAVDDNALHRCRALRCMVGIWRICRSRRFLDRVVGKHPSFFETRLGA